MDIVKLFTLVFFEITVQTGILFVFHTLRGNFLIMQPNIIHVDNTLTLFRAF